ncbi:hypothetical protein MKX07_005900 [Trichoderma sp. CBMAI-0711]|nr:hypothetical protein MKX07_005900 [Trichoderma sp. CBMAI-0711]
MRFSDIRDIDREDISNFVWKWRCKIFPVKETASTRHGPGDGKEVALAEGDEPKSDKDTSFGSSPTIKTLYDKNTSDAYTTHEWVDYPPKQMSKSAARAQDRVAIKVYKVRDPRKPCISGRIPLKYHKIEVQNPTLVAALAPIVKKENCHLDINEMATFEEPFRSLWFCQDDIKDLYKKTASPDPLKAYLKLLVQVLDDLFREMISKRRNIQKSRLVDFRTAWTLSPRGSTVYSFGINAEFLAKVDGTVYVNKNSGNSLQVKAKVLKFTGDKFVWQEVILPIPEFEGNRPIVELGHYPLEFHSSPEDVKRRLTGRGRKVLDLQGLRYCLYNGIALHNTGKDCYEKHNVQGRILLDTVGYNKYHLAKGKRENDKKDDDDDWNFRLFDSDSDSSSDSNTASVTGTSAAKRTGAPRLEDGDLFQNKRHMESREDDLCFISGMMGGYALKNKIWMDFYVEDVEPMAWNDTAFSHLVYDDQQKDLVLSFVQNHNSHRQTASPTSSSSSSALSASNGTHIPMEDVIVGKGQGLIILLSGPPGTGKTLTAEAVADRTHRPLFYLQAEDLGINAASLGANIKRVFEMATEWNAVILLDEADVFMAERNPNDIHRNELVSIFLRELEYFRGIIFLTTNLYHTIDPAFRSRVSLHLLFQSLNRGARETVWRKFLQRLPEQKESEASPHERDELPTVSAEINSQRDVNNTTTALSSAEIGQLSLWQLNGREIKNAVRMVKSWCDHKGYAMTLERLESGIKVTTPHATKEGDIDKDLYE